MEENNTPVIVEPQVIAPDAITAWIEDNRERLTALHAEADQLLRDNYLDSRVVHLGALITGLRNLGL